ncbi:MAG: LemA family protein [Treponema sp.]|nr:LemA family protein [Treponema sp.]
MKKTFKAILTILAAGLLSVLATSCGYNKMVSMDEAVDAQWAQVQNQYQRRLDLIPNLVSTVKGYAKHEAEVFEQIAEARSKAGGMVNVDKSILDDPKAFEQFQKVQNDLGASLQRLLVISENYPALKADQNFLALQDQLEGTENRIATERQKFNEMVKSYNAYIRRFPNNLFAGMFGFEKKSYFAANPEAANAPKVEF